MPVTEISRPKMLVSRWVTRGTVLPAVCTAWETTELLWETPGRQLLAGGRPQLTAGIRAGSYAS